MRTETAKEFIKRKNKEFEEKKKLKFKHIERKGKHVNWREAWVFMPQTNHPEKVFVFERLRAGKFEGKRSFKYGSKIGNISYRFGYFIVGKIGKMKGKWTWGQFCPIIPKKDFNKLIKLAKRKGVLK